MPDKPYSTTKAVLDHGFFSIVSNYGAMSKREIGKLHTILKNNNFERHNIFTFNELVDDAKYLSESDDYDEHGHWDDDAAEEREEANDASGMNASRLDRELAKRPDIIKAMQKKLKEEGR